MSYHPQSDAVPVYKDFQSYSNLVLPNQSLFVNATDTVTGISQNLQQTEWQPSSYGSIGGHSPLRDRAHGTSTGQVSRCLPNPIQFVRPSSANPMLQKPPNQNICLNEASTLVHNQESSYTQNHFRNTSCMYGSTAPLLPVQDHCNYKESSWGTLSRSLNQHSKKKRTRIAFKTDQLAVLEQIFKSQPYINKSERRILSKKLDLCDKSIKVWFQNRRIKEKRDNQPCDIHNESGPAPSEESVVTSAMMDEIDKEIQQPTDNGLVQISERALRHLYLLVNPFLPDDLSTLIAENGEAAGASSVQSFSELSSIHHDIAHLRSEGQHDSISSDLYGTGNNTNASKSSNAEINNMSLCLPVYEPISPEPPLTTDSEYSGIGSPSHNVLLQEFFSINPPQT
ncbi:Protein zerknuellt [Eumeta japonica]|uniref:Protein zerknuellt n=1 Tax=Eumeta variegata TaxID=151549 RepID=A0A4C1VMB4_EUMVA|nr:Protein zerknuellt [Eumeta japonica]